MAKMIRALASTLCNSSKGGRRSGLHRRHTCWWWPPSPTRRRSTGVQCRGSVAARELCVDLPFGEVHRILTTFAKLCSWIATSRSLCVAFTFYQLLGRDRQVTNNRSRFHSGYVMGSGHVSCVERCPGQLGSLPPHTWTLFGAQWSLCFTERLAWMLEATYWWCGFGFVALAILGQKNQSHAADPFNEIVHEVCSEWASSCLRSSDDGFHFVVSEHALHLKAKCVIREDMDCWWAVKVLKFLSDISFTMCFWWVKWMVLAKMIDTAYSKQLGGETKHDRRDAKEAKEERGAHTISVVKTYKCVSWDHYTRLRVDCMVDCSRTATSWRLRFTFSVLVRLWQSDWE